MSQIIANGKTIEAKLPCSIEEFLVAQKLLPRSASNHLQHLPILRRGASL